MKGATSTHCLCLDHVSHSLVERVHLVRLEVADDGSDVVENLFYEWHHFLRLDLPEEGKQKDSRQAHPLSFFFLPNTKHSVSPLEQNACGTSAQS